MAFDLQPNLQGVLIEVRPLRADDRGPLYAVASDPLVWAQHPARDRYKHDVFATLFEQSLASGGAVVVIDRQTGQVIGSSRFHAYSEERSEIEIGWTFLARAYWGGRYNGELKQLMLRHAFRFVKTVVFLIGLTNVRSQKAIERIGAVRAGSRPDARGVDSWVYRMEASAWKTREAASSRRSSGC